MIRDVIHSRAEIGARQPIAGAGVCRTLAQTGPFPHTTEEAYEYYLFHGPRCAGPRPY